MPAASSPDSFSAHQIVDTEEALNVSEMTKELGRKGSVSLAKAICRCHPRRVPCT